MVSVRPTGGALEITSPRNSSAKMPQLRTLSTETIASCFGGGLHLNGHKSACNRDSHYYATERKKDRKKSIPECMSKGCVRLLQSCARIEAKRALVLGLATFVAPVRLFVCIFGSATPKDQGCWVCRAYLPLVDSLTEQVIGKISAKKPREPVNEEHPRQETFYGALNSRRRDFKAFRLLRLAEK